MVRVNRELADEATPESPVDDLHKADNFQGETDDPETTKNTEPIAIRADIVEPDKEG
jgi:hypothetical protein